MSRPRNRLVNAIIFLIAISGLYGYTVLSPKATAPEHIALANELREGYGRAEMNDGTVYVGNFVNGMYQGKGRFETADGQIYEGNFEKNALTGDGTYTDKEGSRYEGEFVDWKFHGAGTYLDAEGTVFKGQFVDGTLTGLGRMAEKQGVRYDGEFKQWRMHGQGTLRLANGDEYIGTFADDTYQGEGTLKYANPAQAGRAEDSGTWHRGILEDKELAPRIRAALPDQRSLLDSAFAKLIPQDPANIDLYFLAVAGDSSQEVFRREVDFVRKKFDREFGTEGRSLILVNSRNTLKSDPMATTTSIRESLKAIATRMDPQNDILFMFLTSHGSKEHEFVLDQNGLDLRDLQAKELGAMLKETGIRWKVILISACYSGGFIDAVKDDHTLVITAARHDRRSFGCADENDFTYFGRAFFKEAVSNTSSFEDAFYRAKSLVEEWEADDFKFPGTISEEAHSLPQMHDPLAIRKYLQRWRLQLALTERNAIAAKNAREASKN